MVKVCLFLVMQSILQGNEEIFKANGSAITNDGAKTCCGGGNISIVTNKIMCCDIPIM